MKKNVAWRSSLLLVFFTFAMQAPPYLTDMKEEFN